MNKGKAYANRRSKRLLSDLRASDLYETPKSIWWEFLKTDEMKDIHTILEPACGFKATSKVFEERGFDVTSKDLMYGNDFLEDEYEDNSFDCVLSNPPFSHFDSFIEKAKKIASRKVVMIGKTNFLGAYSRYQSGLFNECSAIYVLNRQIDYQFPVQENGDVGVGCLVSCVYVWTKGYKGDPVVRFLNMQPYCKLGSYENWIKNHPEYERPDSFEYEGKIYTQQKLDLGEDNERN